jgi:glycosyltransferase involved in cell wall biosynthesis
VLRTALEKIDARIAVSEAARTTFVEHLGGDAVLIPNGVATHRYQHADPLEGWPGTGGVIGFLGRMDEPRKGLSVLLKAFELLAPGRPGLRLLIAGPGDADEQRHKLPAALRDRAAFLGEVSEEDKVRVLHSVDVFCSPNTGGESFGIVTAEAMAAGVPIVACSTTPAAGPSSRSPPSTRSPTTTGASSPGTSSASTKPSSSAAPRSPSPSDNSKNRPARRDRARPSPGSFGPRGPPARL